MTAAVTDVQLLGALHSTFGFSSFRPLQEEIVRTLLAGRDAFVLMPTGGGKSLCYQLPALLLDGTTIVVSPLIALMKDQVDALRALGVAAIEINSALDSAEVGRRQASVARGEVKLLYVAPERLMTLGFLNLLSSVKVALFAIDEAHCISEWGHDFRPEYRELRRLREQFPDTPLAALTATATARVQADIVQQLGLRDAANFRGSFNRPNLYYEVRPKQNAYPELVAFLREREAASGIVYCWSRAATEELAARLQTDGFSAAAYHAGLPPDIRRERQEAFIRDDLRIIVATIAFGMGIDKPDVRFVVHFDLPRNLEGYYQESGRAGRDGEPSDCLLFYSYGDAVKLQRFIDDKSSDTERLVAEEQLRQMAEWADTTVCRRRALLSYFDEPFDGQEGRCCDVCTTPFTEVDYTVPAQMFMSCILRTRERFGAGYVIEVLRGSQSERIRTLGHNRLSTFGIGKDRSKEEWQHIARELQRRGYVKVEPEPYPILKLTPAGRAALVERLPISLPAPRARRERRVQPEVAHPVLFERLREVRKEVADAHHVPPYVVFHDTALRFMAARLPTSTGALLSIPGVGQHKAQAFGTPFVQEIQRFVEETGAQPAPDPAPTAATPKRPGSKLTETVRATADLVRAGLTVSQVAARRQLAEQTVQGHLVSAIEAGEDDLLPCLVGEADRRVIEGAFARLGTAMLTPVFEELGGAYDFRDLAFVRAGLNRAAMVQQSER